MTQDRPKKKRFEGLIHFKKALRQSVVCLQAAMDSRFMTALDSNLVKQLDEATAGVHHLLFTIGHVPSDRVDHVEQLTPNHLLASITQVQTTDMRTQVVWHSPKMTHISVWIDANDSLVATFFFWLVSIASRDSATFDLSLCLHWGGASQSGLITNQVGARDVIHRWQTEFRLLPARTKTMCEFVNICSQILKTIKCLRLVSDGSYVGLIVEGHDVSNHPTSLQSHIDRLTSIRAHTVVMNLASSSTGTTQIMMLSSIYDSHRATSHSSLRGFVILQNMRPTEIELVSPSSQHSA